MRFSSMWYMRPAKALITLIRAFASRLFYDSKATVRTPFGVSKLKGGCTGSSRVHTCQHGTLLEITCRCSIIIEGTHS